MWCGTALKGRRRRWCSDECERTFTREHNWQAARAFAIRRDEGRCVSCGVSPDELVLEWHRLRALLELIDALMGRDVRARARELWHLERQHMAAWRRDIALEVNHRTPILGRHGEFGCHHHVDGLETLCHRCHLDVTAEQFGHRRAAPPEPSLFDAEAVR